MHKENEKHRVNCTASGRRLHEVEAIRRIELGLILELSEILQGLFILPSHRAISAIAYSN